MPELRMPFCCQEPDQGAVIAKWRFESHLVRVASAEALIRPPPCLGKLLELIRARPAARLLAKRRINLGDDLEHAVQPSVLKLGRPRNVGYSAPQYLGESARLKLGIDGLHERCCGQQIW